MTVHAKAIVGAFYGRAPAFAYWVGCSSGETVSRKRSAFPTTTTDRQRRAGECLTRLAASSVWIAQATLGNSASYVSRAKFALLHRAALDACDALDGVKDGIADPTRCHFDPQVLQCREGDEGPGCLTAAQVDAVRKIYSGPRDPVPRSDLSGPGADRSRVGELSWGPGWERAPPITSVRRLPESALISERRVRQGRRHDRRSRRGIDQRDRSGHRGVHQAGQAAALPRVVRSADRAAQHGRGYTSAVSAPGAGQKKAVRLFMAPGMSHCGGGEGPNHLTC
jgi:feruloyl esterase